MIDSGENSLKGPVITGTQEGTKDTVFQDNRLAVPDDHGLTVGALLSKDPNRLPETDTLKTDGDVKGKVTIIDDGTPKFQ